MVSPGWQAVSSVTELAELQDAEPFRERSAAVLFLLHNNMDRLERNFAAVDRLMQGTFGEVVYCVYENDSMDGTAAWIRTLATERDDIRLLSEQGFKPAEADGRDSRWRYERMAVCRNQCLDLARLHAQDVDYVIVLDIDFTSFEQVYVAAAIREMDAIDPDWQALCGSGLSQRDLDVYGPIMRIVPTRGALPVRLYDVAAMSTDTTLQDRLVGAAMVRPAFHEPVRVRSAFGGITIYKPSALYPLRYEGWDCEHVCLHRGMQKVFMSHKLSPLMVAAEE
jgi:hypothetical protein